MPRDYVNVGGPGPTQYIFIRPWHDIAYIFVLESAVKHQTTNQPTNQPLYLVFRSRKFYCIIDRIDNTLVLLVVIVLTLSNIVSTSSTQGSANTISVNNF